MDLQNGTTSNTSINWYTSLVTTNSKGTKKSYEGFTSTIGISVSQPSALLDIVTNSKNNSDNPTSILSKN